MHKSYMPNFLIDNVKNLELYTPSSWWEWVNKKLFLNRCKIKIAYQYFVNIVIFYITYLTDIYKMLFVPFSKINNHYQTIMFSCALLVNEIVESYIWLLRTWQEAILKHTISTIITNDDKEMAKAITKILPNIFHKLCL